MRLLLLLALLLNLPLAAQKPTMYESFSQIEKRLQNGGDTLFVINFWATWCKPCVEEIPFFEELNRQMANQKVRVLLLSLDFKSQVEKRLLPFLSERKIQSETAVLADADADTWMPKVDARWDGAIPATWLVRGKKRKFKADKFLDYNELETMVKNF